MKSIYILGVALIIMGAAVIAYDHFSYTSNETILAIGPITASAEKTHTIAFPPLLGWLLVGGGACALAFGAWSRKN